MKHDDECLKKNKSFPCCSDLMCPCDEYAALELQEELDATMMALNILKNENTILRDALYKILHKCDLLDKSHGIVAVRSTELMDLQKIAHEALEGK